MSEVRSKLRAQLITANDRTAIILDDSAPPIWVSFAFVERETEKFILPESILDDWGREISSLALYHWVSENGQQFPRAEIFGIRPNGKHVQRFLREIDLTAKYPCFARKNAKESLESMMLVDLVLIRDEAIYRAKRIDPPAHIPYPFSQIEADWWQIPKPDIMVLETIFSQPRISTPEDTQHSNNNID